MVDQIEKDAMKEVLMRLNGVTEGTNDVRPNVGSQNVSYGSSPLSDDELAKRDMKDILTRLQSVTESAVTAPQREVVEALQTQRTNNGTRVGSWEILILEEDRGGKKVKTYDVIHTGTKEAIARALRLYEAAHGMVILLNRGETVNGKAIRELLELEEAYTRNFIDATRFRKLYNNAEKNKNVAEADIFESRYQAARQHALSAKDRITDLYESL